MKGRKLRQILSLLLALTLVMTSADVSTAFAEPAGAAETESAGSEAEAAADTEESVAAPLYTPAPDTEEDAVSGNEADENENKEADQGTGNKDTEDAVSENTVSENEVIEEPAAEDEKTVSEDAVSENSVSENTVSANGLDDVPASERVIFVENKGTLEEALELLPRTWKLTLEDGTEKEVNVNWECKDDFYNDEQTSFVFQGKVDDENVTSAEWAPDELVMEIYFEDAVKRVDDGAEDSETPMMESILSPNTIIPEIEVEQGTNVYDENFLADYGSDDEAAINVDAEYTAGIKISSSAYNTFRKISATTANFSYTKLSSAEKAFYKKINSSVMNYLYYGKSPTYYNGQPITQFISYGKLSSTQAWNVYRIYLLNNPQAFFLVPHSWVSGDKVAFSFLPDADTPSEIKSRANTIAANLSTMSKSVNKGKNVYQKAKLAQSLLSKRVAYDWEAIYDQNQPYASNWKNWREGNIFYCQSLISVFSGSRKKTVCAGYSKSFMALTRLAGLQSCNVSGSGHEWNKVNLYGYWYCVDVTFDDSDTSSVCGYNYFLKKDYTDGNHDWYDFWSGKAPKSSFDYNVKNPKKKSTKKTTAKKYTVTYYGKGGKVKGKKTYTAKYNKGSNVTLPKPTRSGYTFGGWYTSSNCKKGRVKSIKKIGKNYKLYAKWTKKSAKTNTAYCYITYNCNGGYITVDGKKRSGKVKVRYKKGKNALIKWPNRKGYTFDKWTVSPCYKENIIRTSDGKVYLEKLSHNYTFTAVWN